MSVLGRFLADASYVILIIPVILVIAHFFVLFSINSKLGKILGIMQTSQGNGNEDQHEPDEDEEEPYDEAKRKNYSKWFYISLGISVLFLCLTVVCAIFHFTKYAPWCVMGFLGFGIASFWLKIKEGEEKRKKPVEHKENDNSGYEK